MTGLWKRYFVVSADLCAIAVAYLLAFNLRHRWLAPVIGIAISLFQALTTIQEITLTFVPKIVAVFIATVVFLPFMMTTLIEFAQGLFDRIAAIG